MKENKGRIPLLATRGLRTLRADGHEAFWDNPLTWLIFFVSSCLRGE
jgi:hypothetical protein